MVTFIIIRHGFSVSNKENRFSGQGNVDLDPIGYSQARSVAKYVLENFHINRIYSSDLLHTIRQNQLPTFWEFPLCKIRGFAS